MSNENSNNRILGLDQYERELLGDFPSDDEETISDSNKRVEKLFKIAQETRNFEISLYWERTKYYWAFMGAFVVAYGWAIRNNLYLVALIFSVLGFFFALGWYFANIGSKYWQENWEAHVNALGILSDLPIYSITKTPRKSSSIPFKPFPYSVSKINQLLSFIAVVCWPLLFSYTIAKRNIPDIDINVRWCCISLTVILSILATLLLLILVGKLVESSVAKNAKKNVSEDEQVDFTMDKLMNWDKDTPSS